MTTAQGSLAPSLHENLLARSGELVALLRDLVAIESPSTGVEGPRRVLERLASELEPLGFRCHRRPGETTAGQLVAFPGERPPGAGPQLLLGHADTVWPVGTLADRPIRELNGDLYGPGIFDMKAGLVQIVFALRALADLGLELPHPPVVVINTDEEIGSRESRRTIEQLSRVACRAFVLEPGLGPGGAIKTARKGIGRFTVDIAGKASHAGLDPDAGASAILELSAVIQQLFALNDRERGVTVNVGTIEGGIQPNVVAPNSSAVVDVRVLHPEDARALETAIRGLEAQTPGTSLTVSGGFGRPPMERTEGNIRLFEAARRIGEDLGMDLEEVTAGGGSDGNLTSQHIPTLDGLGTIGDGAHAEGEHIVTDQLVPRAALLGALLMVEEP